MENNHELPSWFVRLVTDMGDTRTPTSLPPSDLGAGFTLPWLTAAQFLQLPPPQWLIENVLPYPALFQIIGRKTMYKSRVLLHLMLCTVYGIPFAGQRILAPGPCVLVAAEDPYQHIKRIHAWTTYYAQGHIAEQFIVVPARVSLFGETRSFAEFLVRLSYMPESPRLVGFDTYSACTVGLQENDSDGASLAIERMEQVRDVTKYCVGIAHHAPKGEDKHPTSRGHTRLIDAMSAVFTCQYERGSNALAFECAHQRVAQEFEPVYFSVLTVPTVGDAVVVHDQHYTSQRMREAKGEPLRRGRPPKPTST